MTGGCWSSVTGRIKRLSPTPPIVKPHNDLPWNIRKFVHNQLGRFNFSDDLRLVEPWSKSNWSHTDLPRLKEGLVGGQVSRQLFI
ncbi:unnamed protein product [Nezara viridula]|uniref:Dipeptidase n=1 Tax=Nezara viridula TaxID=85310 RepID=A0A9P0MNA0_NEZVI|nr:unnamed protein product [Nezara viridula]